MNKELMKKGLERNKISEKNIELFFKELKKLEKLGFEFEETDVMDNRFYIKFSIKN
jgi:pentose-5-phosphate-3-epimerase